MDILVRQAKKHDKDAFSQLMKLHTPSMYKIAKAILKNDEDTADAIQETALTCWEKIGTLKKDKYFKTWLIRILINHCNQIFGRRVEGIPPMSGREIPHRHDPVLCGRLQDPGDRPDP